MIAVTDLRPGITIEIDGKIWQVIEYNHIKMGRGGAVIKIRMKNIREGGIIEKSFKNGDKVARAHIERKNMQFLYESQGDFNFMDQETFDQISLNKDTVGDFAKYMKEGLMVTILFYEGQAIGVDMPAAVELKVTQAPPGVRGDTVSGGSKTVTVETGAQVQAPLFIEKDEIIKIDTRTGKYLGRA